MGPGRVLVEQPANVQSGGCAGRLNDKLYEKVTNLEMFMVIFFTFYNGNSLLDPYSGILS